MSNAPPAMVPTFGKTPMLGENPLAIAIPSAEDAAPFALDIATTAWFDLNANASTDEEMKL